MTADSQGHGRLAVLAGSGGLLVAIAYVAWGGVSQGLSFAALLGSLFLAFLAVNSLPVALPRGGTVVMDYGVAAAALLLLAPAEAAMLCGTSVVLARVILARTHGSQTLRLVDGLRRGLTLWAVAHLLAQLGPSAADDGMAIVAIAGACAAIYAATDVVALSTPIQVDSRVSWRAQQDGRLIKLLGPIALGKISIGLVLGIVYPRLGLLSILVLVALMLILENSFALLIKVRSAYGRTVGALTRVAEMQNPGELGHSERVADMSVLLGRRLGLGVKQLQRLGLAAVLHDVGGIGEQPGLSLEGGTVSPDRQRAVAGATLVSQVDFLASCAPIILQTPRRFSDYLDSSGVEGLLARIIRVCSDIDDLRSLEGLGSRDVVEVLWSRSGSDYDPRVVAIAAETLREESGATG